MTELTPEQLAEIRRQQSAWNNEFRVRPAKPNIGIEDFCAMHTNVAHILAHIDAQAARIAEREKPCVWTPEGEDSSSWNTGCGSSFWFDDGHEGVNFCPFCGHPAVFDHEGDEA